MKIAIIGATGNVGSRLVDEALARGHEVIAVTRNPQDTKAREGLARVGADTKNPQQLALSLSDANIVITALKWTNNNIEDLLATVKLAKVSRAIFVIGAGSLQMPDGRLWFDHMKDLGILPPTSGPALEAFRRLQDESEIDWVAVSPAADIDPGERTGKFRIGGSFLLMDTNGESKISFEDFAVAILDEVETPSKTRERFTVAY